MTAKPAGGSLVPVDRFIHEPFDRAGQPLRLNLHAELGVPDHDAGEREAFGLVPLFGQPVRARPCLQDLDRRGERLGAREPRLNLLGSEPVSVVQERFVGRAVDSHEAGVDGVGRVVVLVASDSPVSHVQSRPAEAMSARSRMGGATNVGVFTGVSATISAGERIRPSIVPNAHPASAAITVPAATSCNASPRKVQT